jgi:hypothetical protein
MQGWLWCAHTFKREWRPGAIPQQVFETPKIARHVAVEERDPDAGVDREPAILPGEHVGGGSGVEEASEDRHRGRSAPSGPRRRTTSRRTPRAGRCGRRPRSPGETASTPQFPSWRGGRGCRTARSRPRHRNPAARPPPGRCHPPSLDQPGGRGRKLLEGQAEMVVGRVDDPNRHGGWRSCDEWVVLASAGSRAGPSLYG